MVRRLVPLLLVLVACDKKAPPGPSAAFSDGALMFPAETRAMVAVRVDKLAGSPLAQPLVTWLLDGDATRKQALSELLMLCAIDPRKDLESVTIGMGADPSEVAVLAKGRLEEAALVACLTESLGKKGGSLTSKKIGDRVAHNAVDPQTQTSVWITFGGGTGAILSTSEAWLAKVLDDKAPKAASRPDTAALLGRVAKDAAVWGVLYLDPATSQRVAEMTKGSVQNGPVSVTGELALASTAALSVKLDLPASEDAMKLVDYARSQHIWLSLAAQKLGIGRIVNKVLFAAEGKVVSIGVTLDQLEITQLVEALDKLADK